MFCLIFRVTCIFVLCLTVVPLPPGKNPFAVQLYYNNNNNNNNNNATVCFIVPKRLFHCFRALVTETLLCTPDYRQTEEQSICACPLPLYP
jgi:hypothetical protein